MTIPPGPRYLFGLLPFLLVPSALVYGFLELNNTYLGATTPKWLIILATVLARPILSIFQRYYTRYIDRKAAAANNAFIVPHVVEKRPNFAGLSLMKILVEDFKTGYPGEHCITFKRKTY